MRAHTKRTADKQATGAKVCTKAAEHEGRKHSRRTRPTCGKAHAQPPGGGTSLHPGAASQTGQTAAAKAPHTQAHGGQTASRPRQRRPDQARHKSSRLPTSREQGSGAPAENTPRHRAQKPTGQTAAGFEKAAAPADGAARRAQKNPSEQAKFAFALLPARRGHVNRGRQKFASLCLAGTVFCFAFLIFCAFCGAQRRIKGGAAPFYPPQPFEKGWRKL